MHNCWLWLFIMNSTRQPLYSFNCYKINIAFLYCINYLIEKYWWSYWYIYSNKIGLQCFMFPCRSRQVPHADLNAWLSTTRFFALRRNWGLEPSLLGRNSAILTKKNFSIISRLFCLSLVTNCCIYEIFLHFVYFIGLNIAFQDWKVHVLSERLSEQNNIPSREKRRPQCDSTLNIKPVFLVDAVSFSSSVVAMWYKWCRMEVNCSVPVYVINAIVGHCWFVEVDRTVDCLFIQSYYMLECIVNWGTWCV